MQTGGGTKDEGWTGAVIENQQSLCICLWYAATAPEPCNIGCTNGIPAQDPSKCVYCTICAKKCPAGALTVYRAAKTWKLDEDLCIGCGNCYEVCPKKAIVI